jgi:hypothetical protein
MNDEPDRMSSVDPTEVRAARAAIAAAKDRRDAYLVDTKVIEVGATLFVNAVRAQQRDVDHAHATLSRVLASRQIADEAAPDTLRPREARELLGVGRTWLRDRTVDGTIPSFRIGSPDGPLRYSRRALQAIMFR